MNGALEEITKDVIELLQNQYLIQMESSGRHVHLSRKEIDCLFGVGYELTKVKELSQPGQYVCRERLTLEGPKGNLKNVVLLGPPRKESQVEISLTDGRVLGINPPVAQSGQLEGTAAITLTTERASIYLERGLMVAKRHIHMPPSDAQTFQVRDGESVKVKVFGTRPLIFEDVVVRVNKDFRTYMHIDYDEANACGFTSGTFGIII